MIIKGWAHNLGRAKERLVSVAGVGWLRDVRIPSTKPVAAGEDGVDIDFKAVHETSEVSRLSIRMTRSEWLEFRSRVDAMLAGGTGR